jgi:hypothetical protein
LIRAGNGWNTEHNFRALVPGQMGSPDRIHDLRLVLLGDRRKSHDLPILQRRHVTGHIVPRVKPEGRLSYRRCIIRMIAPFSLSFRRALKGAVEAFVGRPPLGPRQGLLGPQRVVDDGHVRRRDIRQLITKELSFSGNSMTKHEIAKAINYIPEGPEADLKRLETAGVVKIENGIGNWLLSPRFGRMVNQVRPPRKRRKPWEVSSRGMRSRRAR